MGRSFTSNHARGLIQEQWSLTVRLAGSAEYRTIVNRHLSDIARDKYRIDLGADTLNFTSISEGAARSAGLPNPEEALFVLLDNVMTRAPSTTDLTGLNRDFVRRSLLASLVHHLREKRQSLSKILKNPVVIELMERYSISKNDLEAYFKGKPANKIVKNLERLWHPSGRTNPFESFDKSKGSFATYIKRILVNEAHDLKRLYDRESDVISHALQLKSDPDDDADRGIDPERSPEFSVDPSDEIDVHLMADQFRRKLRAKNPRYLDLLKLLKDENLDISRPRDEATIQRKLGLKDRAELHLLRDGFLRDLKAVFRSLGADTDTAERLLRIAARSKVSREIEAVERLLAQALPSF